VKVGSSIADEVEEAASLAATLDTEELAALRTESADESALACPASRAAAEKAAVAEKRMMAVELSQGQFLDQDELKRGSKQSTIERRP
jgi:hypothetical protein